MKQSAQHEHTADWEAVRGNLAEAFAGADDWAAAMCIGAQRLSKEI